MNGMRWKIEKGREKEIKIEEKQQIINLQVLTSTKFLAMCVLRKIVLFYWVGQYEG